MKKRTNRADVPKRDFQDTETGVPKTVNWMHPHEDVTLSCHLIARMAINHPQSCGKKRLSQCGHTRVS